MHVTWVNDSGGAFGGCERYIQETAALLAKRGVQSTLLHGVNDWFDPAQVTPFARSFPLVDLPRQVAEIRPDVIYLHRLRDREAVEALASAPSPTLRFVHDHSLTCLREHKFTGPRRRTCTDPVGLRCYPCLGPISRGPAGIQFRTLAGLERERRASQALAGHVVGSQYMAGELARHGFAEDRIHVHPLHVQLPELLNVERDPRRLLFVGQLVRGKGLDYLLEAMTKLRQPAKLRVIGRGRQEGELKAQVANLGLYDRVEFMPPTDREGLHREMSSCLALVFPSRAPETFGLVGLEALAAGTPVVASQVGGISEWLVDSSCGHLFPSGDVDSLAQCLEELLGDPDRARQMGEAGRARAAEFSPDAHADALLELLQRTSESGKRQ
ncbi:MAG: glycosyltransferase family 4 protein [Acidobacteriota bacterium]